MFHRSLKQTFGRRKLRSTNADNARVEVEWSLIGLWAMALYALVAANQCGTPPSKLSIAKTLRAFRRMLRDYRHPSERHCHLQDRLREAVIIYLRALYSNKRGGSCLTYIGTEGSGTGADLPRPIANQGPPLPCSSPPFLARVYRYSYQPVRVLGPKFGLPNVR